MGVQIVVKGRASFLHVFEPHGNPAKNIPPRYGVTVILPEGSDFSPIQAAIDSAVAEKYGNNVPPGLRMPWQWGDPNKPAEANRVLLKCYAAPKIDPHTGVDTNKPDVYDQNNNVITDRSKIYSGCDIEAAVSVFAHVNGGVSCFLIAVKLVEEGEHLDADRSAQGLFGGPAPTKGPEVFNTAPVQPQAPMQPPVQPQAPMQPPVQPQAPMQPPVQPQAPMQPPLPGEPGNDNGFAPPPAPMTQPAPPVAPPTGAPIAPGAPVAPVGAPPVAPATPGAVAPPAAGSPSSAPAAPTAINPQTGLPY